MNKKITWLILLGTPLFTSSQHSVQPIVSTVTADSVVAVASLQYQPNSFLRRILMGNNYRKTWQQQVSVPVFHFSKSGFTIKELGGGMQTKSLHITDGAGKDWSLRTVDKDVSNAIIPIESTLLRKASQDLISAAFPYAAPVVGELAHAAGIIAARPQVFFVADDPQLGNFRPIFANTLCTLEERDPGFDSTHNSVMVLYDLTQNNSYKIQQHALLKARLLDVIIADWDRHADNWRWGLKDSAGFKYYYAIPRDRDWAFYKSKGWIPKLVQKTGGMRCFVNFEAKLKNVKNLSWKSWTFDKTFLNELTAADWEAGIREIQNALTDDVIEKAVHTLPSSVYAMNGKDFISKLKSRRNSLKEEVMKYYRFLSEEVLINGSNKNESFSISTAGDSLVVAVVSTNEKRKLYQRSFSSADTYSIIINGYGGADIFEVDEKSKSKIRITIHGGEGADKYNIKGDIRTKIYDSSSAENIVLNKNRSKVYLN